MSGDVSSSRPGILTFLGVVSLVWSSLSLVGVVLGIVLFAVFGMAGWLGGPVAGAVTMLIGALAILWMVASSFLSFLLARAGWRTLHDDPSGIRLHRTWAWISLALDAVGLLLSGGTLPNSWVGISYALLVLHVTNLHDVQLYQSRLTAGPWAWAGKPYVADDEAF